MRKSNEALIVIDVQNDFFSQGAFAIVEEDSVIADINLLMADYSHIILTQDWHPADHVSFAANHVGKQPFDRIMLPYGPQILWPTHCVLGTPGAEFHSQLQLNSAELILRKGINASMDSYSAFFENDRTTPTGLLAYLNERGLERLTFCGLATDFCVSYSALDAAYFGFQTRVVLGACRAIDIDNSLAVALKKMQNYNIELTLSK